MKNRTFLFTALGLVAASILFWGWMFTGAGDSDPAADTVSSGEITMYRGEGCDCCLRWANYLQDEGFVVHDALVNDLRNVKQEREVPDRMASCHTAVIDGYVVEGHVPAREIRRLIDEKPEAIGIAVPGMPVGSPGMEGFFTETYEVILFDSEGNRQVYARYD